MRWTAVASICGMGLALGMSGCSRLQWDPSLSRRPIDGPKRPCALHVIIDEETAGRTDGFYLIVMNWTVPVGRFLEQASDTKLGESFRTYRRTSGDAAAAPEELVLRLDLTEFSVRRDVKDEAQDFSAQVALRARLRGSAELFDKTYVGSSAVSVATRQATLVTPGVYAPGTVAPTRYSTYQAVTLEEMDTALLTVSVEAVIGALDQVAHDLAAKTGCVVPEQ